MQENDSLDSEFRHLGVSPEARFSEVERSYRWLRELYSPDSLATYSLFNDEERQARLDRVEEAYRKISNRMSRRVSPLPAPVNDPDSGPDSGPLPDRAESPGPFLKRSREKAGLSLREIAERTKISPMKLECLEAERFDLLPASVYLRGFVFEYARTLGLPDPKDIAGLYLEKYRKETKEG
jgi:curved DNA-binding protein CbpA